MLVLNIFDVQNTSEQILLTVLDKFFYEITVLIIPHSNFDSKICIDKFLYI